MSTTATPRLTTLDDKEIDSALTAAGGFVFQAFRRDPRIDRHLGQQVQKLVDWCTAERPPELHRTVPVRWDDYDELISGVLGKLLATIAELRRHHLALSEVDGVSWCLEHDQPWYDGSTSCGALPDPAGRDCVEAVLFHGPAITADECICRSHYRRTGKHVEDCPRFGL